MPLSVKTKTQVRNGVLLLIGLGLCWMVYYNWNRILPAIAGGTESAYEAARDFGE